MNVDNNIDDNDDGQKNSEFHTYSKNAGLFTRMEAFTLGFLAHTYVVTLRKSPM